MAYAFFVLSALAVTQQRPVESANDDSLDAIRKFWNLADFSNSNRGKNALLVDTEPWIPSKTTQLTFLSPTQPLRVEIELNNDAQLDVMQSYHLLFKCSSGDTFQILNLTSNDPNRQWKVSNPHCTSQLGFVVERHNTTSYGIRFFPESKVPFSQSLEHCMEFSISIRYKQGTLDSASLYVFSLISLFNINQQEQTSNGTQFRQFFLTTEAIDFLLGRKFSFQLNKPVVEINFLDKSLLDVVKRAPNIIRALLTVTVSLKLEGLGIQSNLSNNRSYLITSGEETFVENTTSNSYNANYEVRHSLSLATGQLLIDRSFITKIAQEWDKENVQVTLRVSLNGLRNGSKIERTVAIYTAANRTLNLPPIGGVKQQLECRSFDTPGYLNVSVVPFYTGMRDIALTAPSVCPCPPMRPASHECKSDYSVQFIHLPSPYPTKQHDELSSARYKRSRYLPEKRTITLEGLLGSMDMGNYTFNIRDTPSHRYQLVEANLPMFEPLPSVITARRYDFVELNCKVPRTGHSYRLVSVSSHFQMLTDRTNGRWRELSLHEFATNWLHVSLRDIRKVKSLSGEFHGYRLLLPAADYTWALWRITFICRAQVIESDVRFALGVPKYEFEVRAPVRYHDFGEVATRIRRRASSLESHTRVISSACCAVVSVAVVRLAMVWCI